MGQGHRHSATALPGAALTSVHVDGLLTAVSVGAVPIAVFIVIARCQRVCVGRQVVRDAPVCRSTLPPALPWALTHDGDGEVAQDLPSAPGPAHVEPRVLVGDLGDLQQALLEMDAAPRDQRPGLLVPDHAGTAVVGVAVQLQHVAWVQQEMFLLRLQQGALEQLCSPSETR